MQKHSLQNEFQYNCDLHFYAHCEKNVAPNIPDNRKCMHCSTPNSNCNQYSYLTYLFIFKQMRSNIFLPGVLSLLICMIQMINTLTILCCRKYLLNNRCQFKRRHEMYKIFRVTDEGTNVRIDLKENLLHGNTSFGHVYVVIFRL